MLTISYINEKWQARQMFYNRDNLWVTWYDLQAILDEWATNILVYEK